jgi:hypothetical protein
MSKKLIGLAGKAGAGKDTVADYLWEKEGAIKIAFADALRAAGTSIFGLGLINFLDRDLKEAEVKYWGMTPRRMLQLLGTEATKPVFGDDIWLKRWFLSYSAVRDTDHVVVPDVRFDVEAEAIRHLGGTIIHIVRPGTALSGAAAQHASEAGVTPRADGDMYLSNSSSIEELHHKVDELWGTIK